MKPQMPKSLELAVKQLRQAMNNLQIAAADHTIPWWSDTARAARSLVGQLASALECGPSYKTVHEALKFDAENEKE